MLGDFRKVLRDRQGLGGVVASVVVLVGFFEAGGAEAGAFEPGTDAALAETLAALVLRYFAANRALPRGWK